MTVNVTATYCEICGAAFAVLTPDVGRPHTCDACYIATLEGISQASGFLAMAARMLIRDGANIESVRHLTDAVTLYDQRMIELSRKGPGGKHGA